MLNAKDQAQCRTPHQLQPVTDMAAGHFGWTRRRCAYPTRFAVVRQCVDDCTQRRYQRPRAVKKEAVVEAVILDVRAKALTACSSHAAKSLFGKPTASNNGSPTRQKLDRCCSAAVDGSIVIEHVRACGGCRCVDVRGGTVRSRCGYLGASKRRSGHTKR